MIPSPRLLAAALVLFTIASRLGAADTKTQTPSSLIPQPSAFEIREGDRVLLMGDTLIEREGDYGYLETRMHEQFPDRHFIVRNLGFSADVPLGWSRASFDPAAKGLEKIKEQLALVKPTVVFLGYGMAASLEEMTYQSGDPALNPDIARYGTEHGVEKFKRDLSQLMDLVEQENKAATGATNATAAPGSARASRAGFGASPKQSSSDVASGKVRESEALSPAREARALPGAVRFVLLSPIRHEDLRAIRPGLPDPAEHNKLLEQYSKAIEELAKERGAVGLRIADFGLRKEGTENKPESFLTSNGIHPTQLGYELLSGSIAQLLGWKNASSFPQSAIRNPQLLAAVLKKNALFFHRWRPANETYLFGFRKQEQGKNAAEIPQFDPLIEAADAEIDRIKKGGVLEGAAPSAPKPAVDGKVEGREEHGRDSARPSSGDAKAADVSPFPIPAFTLDDNLEISVFAENPLLEKPTQMNWDARGRLWVASCSMYPMIAPGGEAIDKVLVLEDSRHTGVADKSTVFADGLLLPTGVVPDLGIPDTGKRIPESKEGARSADAETIRYPLSAIRYSDACYVAASTQLLHFSKPDANGKATERRIILSGFGTEDTHHILHTLHWGPDGRLYFHQSVYIHSHIETPWGVVRANAGAVFAYDPRTERVEVFCKGLWNSWGQQEDRWGQMFLTDGAGSTGVSWAFPGAVWNPSEGSRKQAPQISAGGFPKFCGLELIDSPAFPDDWQGNAITCDFRAHRIVRFGINDLADTGKRIPDTGKEEGKSANAENLSGIRYPLSGFSTKEMPDVLRTSDVAFRPIDVRHGPDGALYVADWSNPVINHGEVDFRDPRRDHHHGRIWRITYKGRPVVKWEAPLKDPAASKSVPAARREQDANKLAALVINPNPRVRLEALRALARIPTARSAELILDAVGGSGAPRTMPKSNAEGAIPKENQSPRGDTDASRAERSIHQDPWLDFAAWQSINDLAKPWSDAVFSGAWKPDGREAQLEYALNAIDPVYSGPVLAAVLKDRTIARDGAGPWIELIGKGGSPAELRRLFDAATGDALDAAPRQRALNALLDATRTRSLKPDGDLAPVGRLFDEKNRDVRAAAARLAGAWHLMQFVPRLAELASLADDEGLRNAGFEGFRDMGFQQTVDALDKLAAASQPPVVRRGALVVMARHNPDGALAEMPSVLAGASEAEALETWRGLLKEGRFMEKLNKSVPADLSAPAFAAGLKAARENGRQGAQLAKLIEAAGGKAAAAPKNMAVEIAGMVKAAAQGGDPAEGELIYRRTGCVLCHSIGGAGGKLGPDLTSIGASAPMDYLVESVFDPAAKVKEGYHAFAFTLKDGSQMTGIPTHETATEQFVRPGPGPEVAIVKANIVKREIVGSLMPPGLAESLDFVKKRSLFAFLGQLGKAGPFDASKGNVARVWWLYPAADFAKAVKAEKLEEAIPTYTQVDGQLVRELLQPNVELVAKNGGEFYAVARFEVPTATKNPITLTGATDAWLDGKPLAPSGELGAGAHTLAVKIDAKKLPEVLKVQCDGARFPGD